MGDKSAEELSEAAANAVTALRGLYPDLRDLHVLVVVCGANGVASTFAPAARYRTWPQPCIEEMELAVMERCLEQVKDGSTELHAEIRKRLQPN